MKHKGKARKGKQGTKSTKEPLDSATAFEKRMAKQYDTTRSEMGTFLCFKASADQASDVQLDKFTADISAMLLGHIQIADIQGDERELLEFVVERIGSGQYSRRKICDLLGTVANL